MQYGQLIHVVSYTDSGSGEGISATGDNSKDNLNAKEGLSILWIV